LLKNNISQSQFYRWKDNFLKFGSQAFDQKTLSKKEQVLEQQVSKLKKIIAEQTIELKKTISKKIKTGKISIYYREK
jgi:transposase